MGHSNAEWDGDTLVVRVTGQMPDTWFDRAGNHHSWEMVVEERWTPMGPNHVQYEATMTDRIPSRSPGRSAFHCTATLQRIINCSNLSVLSSLKNISTANGVKKGRQSEILRSNNIKKTRATTRVFLPAVANI